jgi:nucleoside-diphosphate-sugar epimerase
VSAGKVLVTGHRGRLGGAVGEALVGAGHEWVGFDLDEGDIRDHAALTEAAAGCEAIVHLAGLADDMSDDQMEKMSVNAMGTWSVLLAAEAAGIERIVNFSSGKAIGMTERLPDYVPIDDDHPAISTKDYGLSKLFSEDMCEAFTRRTGATTVCLRPVAVFGPTTRAGKASSPRRPRRSTCPGTWASSSTSSTPPTPPSCRWRPR